MRTITLLFFFSLLATVSVARTDTLITIFGVVKDLHSGDTLTAYTVVASDVSDPQHRVEGVLKNNGRYELNLMEVRTYRITYSAPGHVHKVLEVDMSGPTEQNWEGGYGMQVDILLFDHEEGMDLAFFSEPFGISRFNATSGNFEWDQEHTRNMRLRQDALLEEHRKRKGGK